ncbi:MAG TPA: ectoine hydroxylase [Rhodocyclaceae bacterium]|jgi:ectoine hydroxylase|nr:ectoine hydroxylase [Rhodocyclaceae bacterium]
MFHASTALTGCEDRYPSRLKAEPERFARRDPVIYGMADDGPLSAKDLTLYERQGYLSFELFLKAEALAPFIAELHRLCESDLVRRSPQAVIEPDSGELRSVFAIHKDNRVLRRLCHHPRLVAIARQLLGGDVYLHQSRINYKPGFRGREFYWHSDFETWHVEDGVPAMRMVSCSVSLTPNTEFNGPLMLIPGSHRTFVSCTGDTPEENYRTSLRRQTVGVPDDASLAVLIDQGGIVAPKGPAGSVTFFECNLMHGSNSNITPMPRSNIFMVFNSVENVPVSPFCGRAPRPDFIAERDNFAPILACSP